MCKIWWPRSRNRRVTRRGFKGALTSSIAMAALRSTVEIDLDRDGHSLPGVKGLALGSGQNCRILSRGVPSRRPREFWRKPAPALRNGRGVAFHDQAFAPRSIVFAAGLWSTPHIRLDKALQFLIGDVL